MIDLKKNLLRIVIIFCFALLYPSTLPAGLEDFHSRIIKIAFTNGYVRALKYDLDTITVLKESPEDMQKYAMTDVDRYVKEVYELNSKTPDEEGSGGSGKVFRANGW